MIGATAGSGAAATGVTLREMRWWDIDPVLEMEREIFPQDAWSRGLFWSELAYARGPNATRRYLVAEDGGTVVGYGGLSAIDGTGDIQTIAVARPYWGTGLGARILTELLTGAEEFECREVLLEVRVDNTRAQRLYERFGFEPIGIRPNYYQPGNVDALVMRRPGPSDYFGSSPGDFSAGSPAAQPDTPAAGPAQAPPPAARIHPPASADEQGTTNDG